jgi:excisionase family DNA binding protein
MFPQRLSGSQGWAKPQRHSPTVGVYTVAEAATRLGIGRTLAYELIRSGAFPVPVIRLGRRIVVPRAALDALLAREKLSQGARSGRDG